MGCINNIKIRDKKYPSVIVSNRMLKDLNNSRNTEYQSEKIYSKKKLSQFSNLSQKDEDFMDNNPLPFVKIKRKQKLY